MAQKKAHKEKHKGFMVKGPTHETHPKKSTRRKKAPRKKESRKRR